MQPSIRQTICLRKNVTENGRRQNNVQDTQQTEETHSDNQSNSLEKSINQNDMLKCDDCENEKAQNVENFEETIPSKVATEATSLNDETSEIETSVTFSPSMTPRLVQTFPRQCHPHQSDLAWVLTQKASTRLSATLRF